jgi:hypothetical protein
MGETREVFSVRDVFGKNSGFEVSLTTAFTGNEAEY